MIKPLTALITAALIGGLGNTLIATGSQNPWVFTSLRFLIAGIIALYWIKPALKLPNKLKLASLLEVGSILTLVIALNTVTVAFSVIIAALAPILTLIINKITQHQKTSNAIIIPIILGLTATTLIATTNTPTQNNQPLGITLAILSTLLWVTATIINGWYGEHISPWSRTAYTNLLGTTLIAIPTLTIDLTSQTPTLTNNPNTWATILIAAIVAIFPGTIAKALNLYALKHIPIPAVLQASTISIITAVITAAIILGQAPTPQMWAGVTIGLLATITLSLAILKQAKPSNLP